MEQRIVLVLLAATCCLCAVRAAQVAVAHTVCSDGEGGINGACGSATVHSSNTGTVGIGPVTSHHSASAGTFGFGPVTSHHSASTGTFGTGPVTSHHSAITGTFGTGPGTAQHSSTSSIRNAGSATAHSSSVGPDGTITGECAYINPKGESIKIKYQQYPNGKINAEADDSVEDPLAELDQCREASKVSAVVAQQNFEQIQAQHQQLQEQIQRQQQQLQEEIFRQQQAIFNPRNFPLPIGFNPIPFPNFHHGGFGPQF